MDLNSASTKTTKGFTIVELLIVIVVIAILAAITIVSYNGIQRRAVDSTLQSELKTAVTQIKLYQATNGSYPASASLVNNGQGLKVSDSNTLTYTHPSGGYCVQVSTTRAGGISYYQSNTNETIQTGSCAASPVAVVGAQSIRNFGGTTISVDSPSGLPAGIATGDLLIVEIQVGGNNRDITDATSKGWWSLNDTIIGSREVFLIARIYNAGDDPSTYALTLDGMSQLAGVTVALRGHSVTSASDIVVGSVWTRAANGGSQNLIVAPSVTTTTPGAYALAFFGSATTSATTMTPSGSFSLLAERNKNPSPEWPSVFGRSMTTAGATGNQSWTDNAGTASVNGLGLQIVIP